MAPRVVVLAFAIVTVMAARAEAIMPKSRPTAVATGSAITMRSPFAVHGCAGDRDPKVIRVDLASGVTTIPLEIPFGEVSIDCLRNTATFDIRAAARAAGLTSGRYQAVVKWGPNDEASTIVSFDAPWVEPPVEPWAEPSVEAPVVPPAVPCEIEDGHGWLLAVFVAVDALAIAVWLLARRRRA